MACNGQLLARQLGRPADALRKRFGERDGPKALDAAYEAPGSLWRLHLKDERYAVDVKLPGIDHGDQAEADTRVKLAGLEVSWLVPVGAARPSAEVLLFRPRKASGRAMATHQVEMNKRQGQPISAKSDGEMSTMQCRRTP